MNIKIELIPLLAFFASLGALIISLLNYRRGRRIDNENYFYRLKFEAYSKVLGELDRLIWFLYESVQKVSNKEAYELSDADVFKLSDLIDEKIYNFTHLLVDYSFLIEKNVDDKLDPIIDLLYGHDEKMTIEKYKPYHDKINKLSNELNETMREELNIDVLSKKLFWRMSDDTFIKISI